MSILRWFAQAIGIGGDITVNGDALVKGDVRTREANTGGGDVLCRSVMLAPVGFLLVTDIDGNPIGYIGPDGEPASYLQLGGGFGGTANTSIAIELATGIASIPQLLSTTQATSDDSTKAATTAFVKAAISAAGGSRTWLLPIASGAISTKYGSSQKRIAGSRYFDPSDAQWGLGAGSIATLHMLLESTSGSVSVGGELFQQTGTGAPQVIAATSTTTGTTATHVTADVSSAFTNSSPAGIFVARFWTSTPNDVNQATCTGAWIEIKP